ncbi:hypothetical protein PC116_g30428 [Phytophthora cactorum]|nr:hypothetical protein PC116_g30428 [Phytophthora cactorum]
MRLGALQVAKDTLDRNPVFFLRVLHEARHIANGVRDVRARGSHQVHQSTNSFAKRSVHLGRCVAWNQSSAHVDGTHHGLALIHGEALENVIHIAPLAHRHTAVWAVHQLDPKNERALAAVGHLEASLEVGLRA